MNPDYSEAILAKPNSHCMIAFGRQLIATTLTGLFLVSCAFQLAAQDPSRALMDPGPLSVGFTSCRLLDHSRSFFAKSDGCGKLCNREIARHVKKPRQTQ